MYCLPVTVTWGDRDVKCKWDISLRLISVIVLVWSVANVISRQNGSNWGHSDTWDWLVGRVRWRLPRPADVKLPAFTADLTSQFYAGSDWTSRVLCWTSWLLWLTRADPGPHLAPPHPGIWSANIETNFSLTSWLIVPGQEPSLLSAPVNTGSCWILAPTSLGHWYNGHVLVTRLHYQQYCDHLTDLSLLTTRNSNSFYHQSGFTTDVILKASSSSSSSQQKYILYLILIFIFIFLGAEVSSNSG